MIKENRCVIKERAATGVTLISLIVTIIVLLILVGITISTSNTIIINANIQTVNTNMLMIQSKANILYEKAEFNNNYESLLGRKLNEMDVSEEGYAEKENLININIINRTDENLYLLKYEDLEKMGLGNIELKTGQYYIVDYKNEEVIYVPGVKDRNGNMKYKLSEFSGQSTE